MGQLVAECAERWLAEWSAEAPEPKRAPKWVWFLARLVLPFKGARIAAVWIRKPSRVLNTNPPRHTRMLSIPITMPAAGSADHFAIG